MRSLRARPIVVVLGGAGGMGRVAVEHVAAFEDVGELVVADLDGAAAAGIAARGRAGAKTKLTAVSIDVTDAAALAALLERADVVLNTTGPFYRFGVPVLRAIIAAGCHSLDICDDWEPTLEMLALDREARARGVLAVIGMGASPGVSNLLARLACDPLDRVDDLHTAWPIDGGRGSEAQAVDIEAESRGGASAALLHWMQQISGEIQVVEAGELVARRPVQPVALDYPGLGTGTAYTVGHPEPITLRTRLPVHGESANLMLLQSSTAAFLQVLRDDIDAGKLGLEDAARAVVSPGMARQARALARSIKCADAGQLPFFFALARGERAGQRVTVGARVTAIPAGMDGVTGIPLALGLRQLLDGRIDAVGVHPPETVIEPAPLLEALAPWCQPKRGSLEELVVISEEVAPDA